MTEIILPPEENEETPQEPELSIDKPTENSKVITIEFEAKKTDRVSAKGTNQQLYTTDTDAWFEFKETSLKNANGTYSAVFRNRHDGSIFQRTGDVVDGVAYYKIPQQEIRHAGAWRGQVVYTLENGNTTAREFDYDVKGHILDGKDVREIVVEDFNTLMAQLRSMKDNAEVELADLVNTVEQNESERQQFYRDLVEDINEFSENELARESAESVRVANEEERELNEAERISKDSERDSKIEEIERVATEPPKPIHTLKVENEVFSSDQVSVSEGVITINNHNLKVGDKVAFVATATPNQYIDEPFDGAMRLNAVYYVVNISNDSLQISTTQNGDPIVFDIDTKGFLWQFEKVNLQSLQVSGLDGTKYRAVFTGAHDGYRLSRRLLNAYTNPGDIPARYSFEDIQNTVTATDINPLHGVMDIYSEMIFKVINRKILITVNSSFTTIGETKYNYREETYRNRIITRASSPIVGFQDSINLIGVGGRYLFDGSTLEVYEA